MAIKDITQENLDGFIGTENYYMSSFGKLKCTDGVQFLRENGAAWLIDVVESYQGETVDKACGSFQLWTLKVNQDKTCTVKCQADSDTPTVVSQAIEYTDFPLPEIKLYVIDGVILLPSEY